MARPTSESGRPYIHRARDAPIDRHAGDSADVASKPDPAYRRPGESERRGPGTSRYPGAGGAVADCGIGLLIESHQSLGGERYGVNVTVLSVLVEAVFPLPAASVAPPAGIVAITVPPVVRPLTATV